MKKFILFSLFSAVALTACKNDNSEDVGYNLYGMWHPSKNIVVSGADNSEISSTELTACVKSSSYNFRKDGMVYVSTYDTANGTCGLTASYQKKFTYDNVNRILIIGNQDYYDLNKLTDNEMHLITDATTDANNDGVKDKKILVLNK